MNTRYYTESEKRQRKKHIILGLIIILLIIVALFLIRGCEHESMVNKPTHTPQYLNDDGGSEYGEAESTDRDKILEELEKQQLVVTDKLSSNITFPNGESETIGEWIVENPKENTVIMQAQVYLDDVLIAKSTPIYPNQHITGIELLSNVEAGEYEVTAYLDYYDIETKEFISKAGYRIHLTIN